MTNWEEIVRRIERQASTADTLLQRLWWQFQLVAWPEVEKVLGGIAVDRAGRITFTLANLQRAQQVGVVVSAVYRRTLRKKIIDFLVGTFRKLFKLNTDYAREMGNITEAAENRVLSRLLRFYGYDNGKILPGTLFDALAPNNGLTADIARRVSAAIAQRMPLEQFRQQFRADFINPQSGFAARYYRRWTNDLMMQFDRVVSLAYADELGLQHAVYAGTQKDNTREFCEARLNRVYTLDVIANWNNMQWKGKHRDLPVELACGGYNCRHTLNYISPELAAVLASQRGGINTYANVK